MLTGAVEQDAAEYRRLLDHEMCTLNFALLQGNHDVADLKMQAVKRYMQQMMILDWFEVMP